MAKINWPQDQTEFWDFLFANKDYFTEYQTYSPSDEEIEQEFFLSIPTHAQLTQKEVFGIYQADQLMGVVDLLHDYERGTKEETLLSHTLKTNKRREQKQLLRK